MATTIHSLANETLAEIFQFVHVSLPISEWNQRALPSLRLVSPHWDEAILNSPSLWTSIFVNEKSALKPKRPSFESTLARIRRSGDLPLDIKIMIRIPPTEGVFTEKEGHILGYRLSQLAPRIASLDFHAESRSLQLAFLTLFGSPQMPALRTFRHVGLSTRDIGHAESFLPFVEAGAYQYSVPSILQPQAEGEMVRPSRGAVNHWGNSVYPILQDVEIVGTLYDFARFPIVHGIRRLCLRGQPCAHRPSIGRLLSMLSAGCKTLEILELIDVVERKDETLNLPLEQPIVFDRLQDFSLGYGKPEKLHIFMRSIRLPALKKLTLAYTSASVNASQVQPDLPGHNRLLLTLMHHFPLEQIETLSLDGVVLSLANDAVYIPVPGQFLPDYPHAIHGRWELPFFVFLLSRFTSLKHLSLINVQGEKFGKDPKEILSRYWQHGLLPTLETLYLDGSSDGLLELLSAVEDDHRFRNRPKPLRVSVGVKITSCLSDEEKEEIRYYQRVLNTPVIL